MYKVIVKESEKYCLGIVILLPGRAQPASDMIHKYLNAELEHMTLIAIEPSEEWYPIPKGAEDQEEAIKGLKESVPMLENFLNEIEQEYQIGRDKFVLAGFSAGGVMAIQVATHAERPYGAVICHNGAILEPKELPDAKHPTPFVVFHSKNDDCFSWEERYLPMKNSLIEKNYTVDFFEGEDGGHYFTIEDIDEAGEWIRTLFDHSFTSSK
jgi:phospholipase/carboxylesterase